MPVGRKIESIRSLTVINPESGALLKDYDIEIDRGIISAIEPSKRTSSGDVDGTGLFAIPGLIDTHVHSLGFLDEKIPGVLDIRWLFRQQRKNLAAYLRSGVTTIRDMGSALNLIRRKRRQAAQLKIEAPRMLYAGPIFTVPKGYPYYVPNMPIFLRWFTGPIRIDLKPTQSEKQVKDFVDKVAAGGARCIKVGYQSAKYDKERSEIPLIPLSLLRLIVERAHLFRLPVAIHHTFRRDLQNLLDASDIKFDSLEHLTTDEYLTNEDVKRIAQRGIPVSTTLMTYGILNHVAELELLIKQHPERFERKPIEFFQHMCEATRSGDEPMQTMTRAYLESNLKFMSANLKKLFDAGVKIVFATDTGIMSPPGCPHWELKDIIRAGMPPVEALKAATSLAADIIGMPELGRLEVNKIADILLLRKNPLDDIEAVGDVATVIRDGYLVYEAVEKTS